MIVVLDNIRSLYNTGAFFRTADGCAVEKLVLCGITPRPDQGARQARAIAKTALGAELVVPWEHKAETAEVLHISPATVGREWAMAKAWLFAELSGRR